MKYHFFLLAILSIFLGSCDGCKDDCSSGYLQFNLPIQAYGIKDTLHIGDTIRIKFDIPDKITERNNGYEYDFMDYDFRLISYLEKIDTLPVMAADTKATFDWKTLAGKSEYLQGVYVVLPTYSDHKYHYEVLISPKKKGLFAFAMGSENSNRFPLERLKSGPCSNGFVYVLPKMENDTNTNFEFLKQSPEPVYQNLDRQRFDDAACFCFYVK